MKTTRERIAQLGINERHAVSLLQRRARYAQTRDRPKVWPGTRLEDIPGIRYAGYGAWRASFHDLHADLIALRTAGSLGDAAAYVDAWCRLNHLRA